MSSTQPRTYNMSRNRLVKSRFFVLAAVVAFAVCVAKGPAGAAESTAAEPAKENKSKINHDYRRVVKNGKEFFCRREAVTGSRMQKTEICLTQSQMDDLQEHGQEYLRNAQNPGQLPPNVGSPGPMGGT